MTLTALVKELDSLELTNSNECKEHVQFIIKLMMGIHWLHHPITAGTIISRCRRGFVSLEKDSFKCQSRDKMIDIQRASLPNDSVFYGAIGDMGTENGDYIAMLETSKLRRDGLRYGMEELSVSHWVVKQDIDLAIICHPNVYMNASPKGAVKEMQDNYTRRLIDYPNRELIPEYDKLVEFMSSQFAKKVNDGDNYQYMISALFAHYALETEADIIYPSVQAKGHLGYNVALRSDIVEKYLVFKDAEHLILITEEDYIGCLRKE